MGGSVAAAGAVRAEVDETAVAHVVVAAAIAGSTLPALLANLIRRFDVDAARACLDRLHCQTNSAAASSVLLLHATFEP